MKKLLYGWHGEFGWEVMTAYPEIRTLSKTHEVTLVGYADTADMYADLGVHFIPHGFNFRMCGKGPGVNPELWNPFIKSIPHDARRIHGMLGNTPIRLIPENAEIRQDIQPVKRAKICIHARKFRKDKTGRNWMKHNYDTVRKMIDSGYETVFIGRYESSDFEEGLGIDARGMPMKDTIRHIKDSVMVFGPASGPSVLSQWCGTPIFTWSCGDLRLSHVDDNSETRKWNPLKTEHYHPWSHIESRKNDWAKLYRRPCGVISQEQVEEGLEWSIRQLMQKYGDIPLPPFKV